VRIGLVSDVPDDFVLRGIERVVERDRELDDAEAGAEMSADLGDGVDQVFADVATDVTQIRNREVAEVAWAIDTLKVWIGIEILRRKYGLGGSGCLFGFRLWRKRIGRGNDRTIDRARRSR
jgi:hypothetical protein